MESKRNLSNTQARVKDQEMDMDMLDLLGSLDHVEPCYWIDTHSKVYKEPNM